MTEQQQFQPGDRVKITMELTVGDPESAFIHVNRGTVYPSVVELWADELDHVTVELIERPEPPREPGWYPCNLDGGRTIYLLRWNGKSWNWPQGTPRVTAKVDVVGDRVALSEGFEP